MRNINYEKLDFYKILEIIKEYAVTPLAIEQIDSIAPSNNVTLIQKNQKILELFFYYFINNGKIALKDIHNFSSYLKIVEKGLSLDGDVLYKIAVSVRSYFDYQKLFRSDKYRELSDLLSLENFKDNFYLEILSFIKPDGYVESSASVELRKIRNRLSNIDESIRQAGVSFQKELKNSGYIMDDLISVRDGFPCVGIKNNFKNKVDGFIIDTSNSGQTLFVVSSRVVELNNEKIILQREEFEEVRKILKKYSEMVNASSFELSIIDRELLEFEVHLAKALFCFDRGYAIPKLTLNRRIKIIDGVHPFLPKGAIPLNLEIGDNFGILIITGPNAGGKTVLLKSVGLFLLMFQSSLALPVNPDSEFGIFDSVYVSIGDEQSIEHSLSTFSAHISGIIEILNNMTNRTLVLMDELGTGTDPTEGAALAIGILEYLKKKKVVSIITTHYSGLKHYAANDDYIENGSMEYDVKELLPTYKFLAGIPGSSRAFEISTRLGMPFEVIEVAKKNVNEEYINTEKMLLKLEKELENVESLKQELNGREEKLNILDSELNSKREALKLKEDEIKKGFLEKESEFLKESRREFEKIIKDIKESGASKETIGESRAFIENIKEKIDEENLELNDTKKDDSENIRKFKNGDSVLIISKNAKGTIVDKTNKDNEYLVLSGIIKLNVNATDLKYIKEEKSEYSNFRPSIPNIPIPYFTLDLRGKRFSDAEKELDKFISDNIANGVKSVRIIHGKGSGALRQCIQDYCKNSPYVISFDYEMTENIGYNYGITVIALR